MSLKFSTFTKSAAILLLCGFLAACQTTGLKPGSLTSNFAPKGWVSKPSGNATVYLCLPSVCKSPQGVIVGPMKVQGDVEMAIRKDLLSKELMQAVGKVMNVASKGSLRLTINRRIVTKSYSGFDVSARYKTSRGNQYLAARMIVQNDRGSMVASFARTPATARSNLKRFLKHSTIRRLP